MSEQKQQYFQFGITKEFPCNYLDNQQERLIVVTNDEYINNENYQRLMVAGFRRSGNQVYRPHCLSCSACQSIRVMVNKFVPSKSQKRIKQINSDLIIQVTNQTKPQYFDLYSRYINTIHTQGSMYPANKIQYESFIGSKKIDQLFIEIYLQDQLISVAVCDNLPNALSALYTFYEPSLSKRSLGKFSILQQIELCKALKKEHLYLGYQIDECSKMNYKKQYFPHQRLVNEQWLDIAKS